MHKFKLKNLADVRRFLARAANRLDAGEITEAHARTQAYICSVLKSIIEISDLEQRLEALERKISENNNNKTFGSR